MKVITIHEKCQEELGAAAGQFGLYFGSNMALPDFNWKFVPRIWGCINAFSELLILALHVIYRQQLIFCCLNPKPISDCGPPNPKFEKDIKQRHWAGKINKYYWLRFDKKFSDIWIAMGHKQVNKFRDPRQSQKYINSLKIQTLFLFVIQRIK